MQTILVNGKEYRPFNHIYLVARDGSLLRFFEPYNPQQRKDGYLAAGRSGLVHRMVATCWLDKPDEANVVHHKNHNKADNRANNLEWLTPQQHIEEHADVIGRQPMPESAKQNLRASRLGSKHKPETIEKIRAAAIRVGSKPPPRKKGYKASPEMIAKCMANNHRNTACVIMNKEYRSFSEAARDLDVKPHTLRKRCLSQNFPDYCLGA